MLTQPRAKSQNIWLPVLDTRQILTSTLTSRSDSQQNDFNTSAPKRRKEKENEKGKEK